MLLFSRVCAKPDGRKTGYRQARLRRRFTGSLAQPISLRIRLNLPLNVRLE